jgi:hypothetical protein
MTTSIRPPLKLVRGAADELRESATELSLVERYFEKCADRGPREFTPGQLRNFAQKIREGRLVLEAIRRDA